MSPETLVQTVPSFVESLIDSLTPFSAAEFDQHVMTTYARYPIALERGAGCRVWDTDGREYLDFVAGIATCTLGHAHPAMVQAVTEQIQTLHHVSNLYYTAAQGNLAKWLTQHSCADRVFFCNSGAEANEGAIKLARKYAHTVLNIENPVIITANASFHGRTLATVTATGQAKYHKGFSPLVPGFHYVPYNDTAAMEQAIAELDQSERRVAAILLEALQGEGGVRPGEAAYFQRIRQICDEKGILLICDEVQVGMGRSGKFWGFENLGIEPDVFTSAKGLGRRHPDRSHAVQVVLRCFPARRPRQHLRRQSLRLRGGFERLPNSGARKSAGECLRSWRTVAGRFADDRRKLSHSHRRSPGLGLINGLEIKADCPFTAPEIVKTLMENGLLLVPAGPKVVRFVPPLIVSEAEIALALAAVNQAFCQSLAEIGC